MSDDMKQLYDERLGRFLATLALEPADRVPLATGGNYYCMETSGNNYQQIQYDHNVQTEMEIAFCRKYPQLDTIRTNLVWGPTLDVVGNRQYKLPGRDAPIRGYQQFVEAEWMKADEYRMLIDDPVGFRMERYLPRIFGEFAEKGSTRSYIAFLKSAMAQNMFGTIVRERSARLAREVGMPTPVMGGFAPPLDKLSDGLRGLNGIMVDMFRQPDNVLEACEALLPDCVNAALAGADPKRQRPIFCATHKPCFMSPKQFDKFYWPTFKKGLLMLIEAGHSVRVLLEGDWSPHWHHIAELPKGRVPCDLDNECDVFKAMEAFGGRQCIGGGIPNDMFILGTPDEIDARVKLLCETVGKDGGWIAEGGGNIPGGTKPENWHAFLKALEKYGKYSDGPAPMPKSRPAPASTDWLPPQKVITPWEVKKAELGEITGDEDLIRRPWEMFEKMAYNWLFSW